MMMPAENNTQEIWLSQNIAVYLQAVIKASQKWRRPIATHQSKSIVPQREI